MQVYYKSFLRRLVSEGLISEAESRVVQIPTISEVKKAYKACARSLSGRNAKQLKKDLKETAELNYWSQKHPEYREFWYETTVRELIKYRRGQPTRNLFSPHDDLDEAFNYANVFPFLPENKRAPLGLRLAKE